MTVYDNLRDVKIIRTKKSNANGGWSFLFFGENNTFEEPNHWVAIYHMIHKKWLVTDDISGAGLNDKAENLMIVGHSDSLDGIMFVVWEHQKSLGLDETIYEEIRAIKGKMSTKANDSEWEWAKKASEKISSSLTLQGKPFGGTIKFSESKMRFYDEKE